jgi:hypothetical protein
MLAVCAPMQRGRHLTVSTGLWCEWGCYAGRLRPSYMTFARTFLYTYRALRARQLAYALMLLPQDVSEQPSTGCTLAEALDCSRTVRTSCAARAQGRWHPARAGLPPQQRARAPGAAQDHLDELRERVLVGALAAGAAVLTCFAVSKDLVVFLEAPVASQGVRFLQLSPGEFFFTTLKARAPCRVPVQRRAALLERMPLLAAAVVARAVRDASRWAIAVAGHARQRLVPRGCRSTHGWHFTDVNEAGAAAPVCAGCRVRTPDTHWPVIRHPARHYECCGASARRARRAGGGLRGPAAGDADGAVRGGRVRAARAHALGAPPARAHHLWLLHPLLPGVRCKCCSCSLLARISWLAHTVRCAGMVCTAPLTAWLHFVKQGLPLSTCSSRPTGALNSLSCSRQRAVWCLHSWAAAVASQRARARRLLFSYEVLTPAALNFFVSYADGAVESLWSIDQYFEFVLVLMLSTGLSFQARLARRCAAPARSCNAACLLACVCSQAVQVVTRQTVRAIVRHGSLPPRAAWLCLLTSPGGCLSLLP